MSAAIARKPRSAKHGSWCRQESENSGHPWTNTIRGASGAPASRKAVVCRSVFTRPSVTTDFIGRPRSGHAVASELRDLLGGVPGFGQDLLGVLTEGRRLAIDPGAPMLQAEARAHEPHRPIARVDGLEHVPVLELRVADDLVDLPDGAARHVGRGEACFPGAGIALGHGGLDDLAQGRLVGGAGRPVLEARVTERVGATERL